MQMINWRNSVWNFSLVVLAMYVVALLPESAMAQQEIGDVLCQVASWFTGKVGQGIATLAIIVIGVGALMGKVSWGMAIIVGVGIAVIFGAPAIVDEIDSNAGVGSNCDGTGSDS